ncbi:non-canonical purine NTP pyrophosphatase, partial [Candidatus Falkowbacteria bacterium]|nr:non-canonical purine NTP pyrophosphatase [Candidatus Falkowbacteria bacterium]
IVEIQHALADFDWEIIGLADTAISPDFDVEEPAMTMEGNAIIKAITYGDKTGLLTLSEDAGLEVD